MPALSTRNIPRVRDYADALRVWNKNKLWRGATEETDPRPLDANMRRAKHMTVRKLENGALAFSLYGTDLVTYEPDGALILKGYPSKSSDHFAYVLTPYNVRTSFKNSYGCLFFCGEVGYLIPKSGQVKLARSEGSDNWSPVSPTEPFETYVVDRAKAREALKKHGFYDFLDWSRAAIRMKLVEWGNYQQPGRHELIDMLHDRERWSELLVRGIVRGVGDSVGALMQGLRVEIYKLEGVVEKVEVPTIGCVQEWRTIQKNKFLYR